MRQGVIRHVIGTLLLFVATVGYAQQITVVPRGDIKDFEGEGNKARVNFYSASPDLLITENNGEKMQGPEKVEDGWYLYTFICDVEDTYKFGFNVSAKGNISKFIFQVYIEENQLREYEVEIKELPVSISEVKVSEARGVVPVENKAVVKVTSNYQGLRITSTTGEESQEPVLNATNTFDYTIDFDLSTPQSRETVRSLIFSAGSGEPVEQEVGVLSPKQGVNLSVLVVTNSCYSDAIAHARQSFLNGAYREAYDTYRKLLEGDNCPDTPKDRKEDENSMKDMRRLASAHLLAVNYYKKAEDFQAAEVMDSCMYYQSEAYKYRNLILKQNPSDPYCLEYNRKYADFINTSPRIVSGQVLNAVRMDAQGRNLPLAGVRILQIAHKKETDKVNGVPVPKAGKRIDDTVKQVGESDENGQFSVAVDRNTNRVIYVLYFTADSDVFSKKSDSFQFIPKDIDKEGNVVIKMVPTTQGRGNEVNRYNKTQ